MKRNLVLQTAFLLLFIPSLLAQEKLFTNQQINGSTEFLGKSLAGVRWIAGGERFTYTEFDPSTRSTKLFSYRLSDGRRELLLDSKDLVLKPGDPPLRFSAYQWSPDERQILFVSSPPERQYFSRLTPAGNFYLYDLSSKRLRQLTDVNEPQYNQKFSPDGRLLGFVRSNNIYVIDLATGSEVQVTLDGTETVINGKFDWVYEEEFGISDGWQWSPDGKKIAYWQLDETRVPQFTMTDYLTLRSEQMPMRYPKAGDPNSIVKVGVVSLSDKKTTWLDLGPEDDIYIPRIEWTGKEHTLALQRLNRLQNRNEVLLADVLTGMTRTIFVEEEKTWVEVHDDWRFFPKTDRILWSSERDGFNHLYWYSFNGREMQQITRGAWEVGRVVAVDEAKKIIYFTAWEKTPLEQHLYAIRFDGTGMKRITPGDYNYSVNVSPNLRYFIGTYSAATTPPKIALFSIEGKMVRMIEENPMPALKEYRMGEHAFFAFSTTDGVELNGWMIKPIDFDPAKRYPVLLYVYAGPGSQTVANSWGGTRYLWHQLMAQKGYVVASVDGRGTGRRGKEFRSLTYRNLGKWEVNDQIEAAKYLSSLPFIDRTRIGIWGWSYGGYMSSLTLLQGADYFKAAVAVAPVTHWRFYDTIYTERYMQRPQDNEEGYRESAPLTHADKLEGKLLLIHGTTDDNVHWQNTVQFVDALQKAGKQFQTMFYPNKNHGISGAQTRTHLFEMVTNFLLENL